MTNKKQEDNNFPIRDPVEPVDDGGVEGARELLSQTTWRTEAMQIPLESITDLEERNVIIKCINMDELTPEEHTTLEGVLVRYRPAIHEQNPLETIESYHENIEYVDDEKAFLELLDHESEEQSLTMYYPLMNGREARLELSVKPITDAQAVLDVSENLDLFRDYTQEEIETFNDYNNGKTQTPEERAIAERIQKEIAFSNANRIKEVAVEFLALQTTFKDKDSSYEDMKQIYEKMNVGYLLLLFSKVKDLTHLEDVDTERMFRQSD